MKRLISNKKGGNIYRFIAATLMLNLIVVVFYTVPVQVGGFWDSYKYTPPSNSINDLDTSSEIDSTVTSVKCDIKDDDSCNQQKKNPLTQTTDFIGGIVGGAYAGIITIIQTLDTAKILVSNTGVALNIPEPIIAIVGTLVIGFLVITMLLLIFNRSDTV